MAARRKEVERLLLDIPEVSAIEFLLQEAHSSHQQKCEQSKFHNRNLNINEKKFASMRCSYTQMQVLIICCCVSSPQGHTSPAPNEQG